MYASAPPVPADRVPKLLDIIEQEDEHEGEKIIVRWKVISREENHLIAVLKLLALDHPGGARMWLEGFPTGNKKICFDKGTGFPMCKGSVLTSTVLNIEETNCPYCLNEWAKQNSWTKGEPAHA